MNATNRTHFEIDRQAEYFDKRELEIQTGQGHEAFGVVVLKELIDNALDACESIGIDPVIHIGYAVAHNRLLIAVSDNGAGMSEDVIKKTLNFNTRTSDKAAYKSPTRGAQGNAFKTIIGIPHALGGGGIVIESKGLRHEITASATPAGAIVTDIQTSAINETIGTVVYVDMPWRDCQPHWYARATALFNPHALVKISGFDDFEALKLCMVNFDQELSESGFSYNKLSDCKKIKPNDPTNVHCYDQDGFHKLFYIFGEQRDMPLGQFVRQFDGLTSTSKAKKITGEIPFKMVSDIYKDPIAIESMRQAMQSECRPIQPKSLGAIGEANLLARLNLDRHWYKQVSGMIDNIPYLFEILIGESEGARGFYYGVNHSPTFGDFLRQSNIKAGEIEGEGIKGALAKIIDSSEHIVIIHLIGISLPFMERGKSNLKKELPVEMIGNIAGAVWHVAKDLHKEYKARLKDAAKADRDYVARKKAADNSMKTNAAVFKVLPDCLLEATVNNTLPVQERSLYYEVRAAIQKYTSEYLTDKYFGDILTNYWREFGRNKLVYNDPRGVLHTPHGERLVPLGTLEVDAYEFPSYEYNKILYIEKKGLWHTIKASGLHKKYDMAVIAGEGYASEAVRVLLAKAQAGQDYTIFVLHDADPAGYNIARTIAESTELMPDHNIEVIDLGLNIQDAIDLGLPAETFTRKNALAKTLEFNEIESEYFGGIPQVDGIKTSWICQRVELNAMSPGQLVDYIDAGISKAIDAKQLAKKVIPGADVQLEKVAELFESGLRAEIDDMVTACLNLEELKLKLLKAHTGAFDKQEFKVEEYLADNELYTWKKPLQIAVDDKLEEISKSINDAVKDWLKAL